MVVMFYFIHRDFNDKEFRVYLKKAIFESVLAEIYLSQDKENFETTGHAVDMFEFKGTAPIEDMKWAGVSHMTLSSWYNKAHEMNLLEYDEDGNPTMTLALRHEFYQSPYSQTRQWCLFVPTHLLPLKNVARKLLGDYLKKYAERWAGK